MALDESLVRENLDNWLGFGNPNGKYWFIGREESVSLANCERLDSWADYFRARRAFGVAVDFREAWEGTFGRPLETFTTTTTWHYQVAFLLAFHGVPVSSERVRDTLFENPQFGRTLSDHFSGEFFPLPKRGKDTIEPYDHIWSSPAAYRADVMPARRELLVDTLRDSPDVDWLITYSDHCAETLRERFPTDSVDDWEAALGGTYRLEDLRLDGRTIGLLETPFLGYGHVGYDGIESLVDEVRGRYYSR